MTVDGIIESVYPQDVDLWPRIRQKLIETNAESFEENSDRLVPGTRLKLVDIKRIYEPQELAPGLPVGYVVELSGKASVGNVNGRVQQLQADVQIFEGDRLETGPGSNLHVLMDDGAEVFLKEDSVLKVTEYVVTSSSDRQSSSVLDLLRGGLRTVTGAIGASTGANYQLHTGVANIGIRGTEYVIKLCKQDDCSIAASRDDPAARLHAVVLEGSITLTGKDGFQVLMAAGEYATATPQVLTLEDTRVLPTGFLDEQEARKFNPAKAQKVEQEEESPRTWMWIVGILLLVVGL